MQFVTKKSALRITLSLVLLFSVFVAFQQSAIASCLGYTKSSSVELKKTDDASSKSISKLDSGSKVDVLEQKNDWYRVSFGDIEGYIHVDDLDLGALGAKLTISKTNVNVRSESNTTSKVVSSINSGDEIAIVGLSGQWYKIDFDGKKGYIRSDLLHESDGKSTVSAVSTRDEGLMYFDEGELPEPIVEAQAEKEKESVEKTSVTDAQKLLKQLNFFYGEPDGKLGAVTQSAVKAFQTAFDLEVDGSIRASTTTKLKEICASEKTTASAGSVKISDTGVVLAEWFNYMKYRFPVYESLRVVDVATGVEFKLRAFSAGNHADVEPPTKEDTDILYKINGDKWSWDPRPVWVYIEGVCYAAVINVKPHGPDTLPNNGMSGQICMHFLYSRNHNTGQENKNMQAGILEAFEKSQSAPVPQATDFSFAIPLDLPQE